MNTSFLEEFVYLANCLNFRKTADHFYVNRSVISRHMIALEKELGAVLFERTTRGVGLTEAGSIFLQEAQTVLRNWELACSRVREVSGTGDELVRMGYLRNGARPFLARFVKAMAQEHPEVHLSLLCMSFQEARQALKDHGIDVLLGINVDGSISEHYRSTLIYEDEFMVMCSSSHPLAQREEGVALEDLRDQKVLVPDSYVSSHLAPFLDELIDEEMLAESEELYKDMDLLYLRVQTEECLAFVSGQNASMFADSLAILPIKGLDTAFTMNAFYHGDFKGRAYEICRGCLETCRRSLEKEPPRIPQW